MNMELFGSAQESKENKFYFYLDAFRSRQAARAVKITSANWITSKSQGGISTMVEVYIWNINPFQG